MRVLIVDDSDAVRHRLRQMLSGITWLTVEEAGSFSHGLLQLKSLAPDFLVLDIQLPDASGLELLRLAKQEMPSTLVMMFTNHVFYRKRCAREGADFFFDKSMDFEKLVNAVLELSQGRRA